MNKNVAEIPGTPFIPEQQAPVIRKTFSQKLKGLMFKVWEFAKWMFLMLVNVALFITNPAFFVVGFGAGIMFTEKMNESIQKVKNFIQKQKFICLFMIGIGAFFSLPITLASASLLFGGYTGSRMSGPPKTIRVIGAEAA